MTTITQDILNQVFREYMKTVSVPTDDSNKDVKIASLIPKFEQHVNQLTSEYKGLGGSGGSVPMVRRLRSTMRNRAPFMFRRSTRRSRGWWLPNQV